MGTGRCSLPNHKAVADASQFPFEWTRFFATDGLRCLDDAVIVSPAMLPDLFVAQAKPTQQVGWDCWEESDDLAVVLPPAKDNERFFVLGHFGVPCSSSFHISTVYN